MLAGMSPQLFDEWIAYAGIEPFGESWRQTAEVCATTLNAQGGKRGGQPFLASEMHFMPQEPVDPEEVARREATAWRAYANRVKQAQQRSAAQKGSEAGAN